MIEIIDSQSKRMIRLAAWVLIVLPSTFLFGACSTLAGPEFGTYDSLEKFNRKSYQVTDWADRKVVRPIAKGYERITPKFWRTGVANVFGNLRGIDSSLNGFLQGKPKAGGIDFARVIINSTLGLGGWFDIGNRVGLVAQEEDFGQTLAVWGVKRTRYFYIPFLGPTTLRDLPSVVVRSAVPRWLLGNAYEPWMSGLDIVNSRAELLVVTDTRDSAALDPYAFTMDAYYQRRKFLIFDGDPPFDDFGDEFDDEDFDDEDFDDEELENE